MFFRIKKGHGLAIVEDKNVTDNHPYNTPKPAWVIQEVIRLKAIMGNKTGCRSIASTFNRLHGHDATVGKSFVAQTIKANQYAIAQCKRNLKKAIPRPCKINSTWAMDLSFCTDHDKIQQPFLGILDHGSRVLTHLKTIANKSSWTLLGHLCLAIGKYGKPKRLRTDNEAIFTSFVFTTFLKLVGIKHQRIPTASPWCNGRIERLFGTLKPLLRQLIMPNKHALNQALQDFKYFYNHIRPHQNLGGKTPVEVWCNTNTTLPPKQVTLVKTLDGLLVGFKIRR